MRLVALSVAQWHTANTNSLALLVLTVTRLCTVHCWPSRLMCYYEDRQNTQHWPKVVFGLKDEQFISNWNVRRKTTLWNKWDCNIEITGSEMRGTGASNCDVVTGQSKRSQKLRIWQYAQKNGDIQWCAQLVGRQYSGEVMQMGWWKASMRRQSHHRQANRMKKRVANHWPQEVWNENKRDAKRESGK